MDVLLEVRQGWVEDVHHDLDCSGKNQKQSKLGAPGWLSWWSMTLDCRVMSSSPMSGVEIT